MCSATEMYISENGFYINILRKNVDLITGNFIIGSNIKSTIYPFEGILQYKKALNCEFSFIIDWYPNLTTTKSYTAFFARYYQNLKKIHLKWALWHRNNNDDEVISSGADYLLISTNDQPKDIITTLDIYKVPHPIYFKNQVKTQENDCLK